MVGVVGHIAASEDVLRDYPFVAALRKREVGVGEEVVVKRQVVFEVLEARYAGYADLFIRKPVDGQSVSDGKTVVIACVVIAYPACIHVFVRISVLLVKL